MIMKYNTSAAGDFFRKYELILLFSFRKSPLRGDFVSIFFLGAPSARQKSLSPFLSHYTLTPPRGDS